MLTHLTKEQLGRALADVRAGIEADVGGDGGYFCLSLKGACERFFINRSEHGGDTRYADASETLEAMGVFAEVQRYLRGRFDALPEDVRSAHVKESDDLIVECSLPRGYTLEDARLARFALAVHITEVFA